MLEWLVGVGAVEIGKAVFEQGLKLTQAAAEDYVKDFFKDCLKEGLALGQPEVTKKAVAKAVKEFLSIVQDIGDHGVGKRGRYRRCESSFSRTRFLLVTEFKQHWRYYKLAVNLVKAK